jgi:hypothetical protein
MFGPWPKASQIAWIRRDKPAAHDAVFLPEDGIIFCLKRRRTLPQCSVFFAVFFRVSLP